jgi:hypothetical protein
MSGGSAEIYGQMLSKFVEKVPYTSDPHLIFNPPANIAGMLN